MLQGLGVAFCIISDLGVSPYDAIYLILSEKTKIPMRWCRIALDVLCAVAGILIGGAFGAATIATMLFMGIIITVFVKILEKIPALQFNTAA